MNITAIMGCRKNGNTDRITRYFENQLKDMDQDIIFSYLYLYDHDLPFCTGCHNCIFSGEETCPHHSKVAPIEEQLSASDGVVLATPGYMFSVTAIMKNFLDHVAYNCHRPKYFGKKLFILSAATRWQRKGLFTPMETWAAAAGFDLSGKINIEAMPFPASEKVLEEIRGKIKKAAFRFHLDLTQQRPRKAGFGDVMVFRAMRIFSRLAPNIMKADAKYFEKNGLNDPAARWYIPGRTGGFIHALAGMMEGRIRKSILASVDREKMEHIGKRALLEL